MSAAPARPARTRWVERLRPALSGLTTRGRSFLAAGLAAGACSLVLDQRDLLRVALLLVVLPLTCAVVLTRSRYRLALTRTVSPERVVAGSAARIRLEIENLAGRPSRVLLAEDELPYSLGGAPRFVVARLPGGDRTAVAYSVRPSTRGRYTIGPLRLRLADPFGMCELTRSFTATDPLVVVPRVWPLAKVTAGGTWAGTGESIARSAAAAGEDDVATREYRYGDDLRRVHWKSTARRGELMVRRDEQPRQMRATVLLDGRTDAHRGEGPASSFEWAVSAAASAAVSLADQRFGVRVLTDDAPAPWTTPFGADTTGHLLDHFAVVDLTSAHALTGALSTLTRAGGDGLVVAVLGAAGEAPAAALARLSRGGTRGIALLLRVEEWDRLPDREVADLVADRARAVAVLRTGGWSVAEAGPRDTPDQVWARALGRTTDGVIRLPDSDVLRVGPHAVATSAPGAGAVSPPGPAPDGVGAAGLAPNGARAVVPNAGRP